jgi:hypothetical protein
MKSRTLNADPNLEIPTTLSVLPIRAKLRRAKELPRYIKSRTDTDEPNRLKPNRVSVDPIRQKPRSDKDEEKSEPEFATIGPNKLIVLPNLTNERTLNVLPKLTKSRTLKDEPSRVIPKTLNDEPNRAKDRKLIALPR